MKILLPALIMILYAILLVAGGLWAYSNAPEGANAATAIIVPGVCAVLMIAAAVMTLRYERSRRIGMIGIHAGLVLPLLFAVAFGFRANATSEAVDRYEATMQEYELQVQSNQILREPSQRKTFFADRDAPDHDKTYLRNTLWGLTVLSVLAFVALMAARFLPRLSGRRAAAEDV